MTAMKVVLINLWYCGINLKRFWSTSVLNCVSMPALVLTL